MATVTDSVEIYAPVDRVAAFFVPQRMVYWYGTEMNAEFEVAGGAADFRVGQKVKISGRAGKREVSITAVITRYDALHTLEWQFRDEFGIRGLQRWDLTELADGTTRVSMIDDYTFPGRLGQTWDRYVTRHAVALRDHAWLEKLKQISERE